LLKTKSTPSLCVVLVLPFPANVFSTNRDFQVFFFLVGSRPPLQICCVYTSTRRSVKSFAGSKFIKDQLYAGEGLEATYSVIPDVPGGSAAIISNDGAR